MYHWNRIKKVKPPKTSSLKDLLVSVVIVVRNEEDHIKKLLQDLATQTIGPAAFEVLIVNDHSTDRTCQFIQEEMALLPYPLHLLHLASETGKKAGLELGIQSAAGKLISVTDGDCRVPSDWLLIISNAFQNNRAVFTSGPVTFKEENSFFEKLQTIEFASLVGSGAAMLQAGNPGMCNAANMAFLKEVYREVNGFSDNMHIPSGDDEFLLQAIYKLYPKQVFYLKSKEATIITKAQVDLETLFHQRKRWAGKWRLHKDPAVAATAIGVFVFHACWLILFLAILTKPSGIDSWLANHKLVYQPQDDLLQIFFFGAVLLKLGAEYLFLRNILRSFGKKILIIPFLTLQLLYPFYVLIFGIAVNFGSFSWKGRTYKYTNT